MMGVKLRAFAPLGDRSLDELVPADSLYRRLQRTLDLSFVHDLVADCYASGGRPSVDPEVFFKLQLVMFLEGIRSERQLMHVVADRLSVRWYLGYDLHEPLPDHSSLTRIRGRYGVDIFRRFFAEIVERCREAGLVWGRELFFDASKVEANASVASIGPRFAIEAHLAARFPDEEALPTSDPLAAPSPLPLSLTEETREDLATANGQRHDWLVEEGQQRRDVVGRDYRRIADFKASRTDPDASPMHVKGNAHPGYHLHYAIDGGKARIILAALVTPAEVMENTPMLPLLRRAIFRWKVRPKRVIADTTYGTAENIREIEESGIRAYVPLPDWDQRTPYYGPSLFTYDVERDIYLCPQGATLRRQKVDRTARKIVRYRADAAVCNVCPVKASCTPGEHGRSIARSFDAEYLERVRGYHETDEYAKAMRKRKVWIEPLFGEAKQWHGMRQFRLRGLPKVNMEGLMIAAGQNLKRLLSATGWGRRPWPDGTAGFAGLMPQICGAPL